ncbi:MAG: tetratricopeptide repeat protein [Treponema sp.]|jgi:tetratricopeptide (TPR) repeat protein|nr:tetratricopeptide repeat protein [Treponema sp.]
MFKRMTKKQKILTLSGVCAAAVVAIFLFAGGGTRKTAEIQENEMKLVQHYRDIGLYDRALDLLEKRILSNPDDKQAMDLMDEIAAQKEGSAAQKESSPADSSVNVNIDTSKISSAMQSSLSSVSSEIAKTNEAAAKNQEAIQALLEQQKQQAADAAEKAAEQKAAEERAKAAEEQRKAQEAALAEKSAALRKEITTVNDLIEQGKTSLSIGNVDDALSCFSKAQNNLPVSDGEPQFSAGKYSEMAESLYNAARTEKNADTKDRLDTAALSYAKSALDLSTNEAPAHYIVGMNEASDGHLQNAVKELTAAVRIDNSNYLYYYDLGKLQYRTKDYSSAKSAFETAVKLNAAFDPAEYNLGVTLNRLGNWQGALAAFRKVHTINPAHEKSYIEEARILARHGDNNGAVKAYSSALSVNSVNIQTYRELGSVYYALADYSNSEKSFQKAVALLPPGKSDPLTYYNLSTALYADGNLKSALSYASEAYESRESLQQASKVNIVYNYALMNEKSGTVDKAIELYSEVLKNDPGHVKTRINLGALFLSMNPPDSDNALKMLKPAYTAEPDNFEVNNNLGSAYLALKDYDNAITYFQHALKIDKNNNETRKNLAQTYASAAQYDNARVLYLDVLKADNKDWSAAVELAKVYITLGDKSNAEKYLVYVQENAPDFEKDEIATLLSSL